MKKKSNIVKKNFLLIVTFSLFLFFLSLVSAVQPSVVIPSASSGIIIEHPISDAIKQNTDHYFHFHLFNSTSGLPYLNSSPINCIFHLYAPNGDNLMTNDRVPSENLYDWIQLVPANNFTELGQYAYVFQCNSTGVGGFYAHDFEITPSGNSGSSNIVFFVFVIFMLYALTFIGFFGKNIPVSILGGMAMIGLGVYTINNGIIIYRDWITNYFSYITIGIGALFSIWASIELLEE